MMLCSLFGTYIYCTWSFLFCIINANPYLLIPELSDHIVKITSQFETWDFVVHIDEGTDMVSSRYAENLNPVTIFKHSAESMDFIRPDVSKCVNIVNYSEEEVFMEYAQIEGNIQEADIIILIMENNLERDYDLLMETGLEQANIVFLMNVTTAIAIFFYTGIGGILVEVVSVDELSKYRNRFENFYGFPLKVGYTNCPPFIYDVDDYISGVEFKVLEVVAQTLNITLMMENYSGKHTNSRFTLTQHVNQSYLHFGIGCLSNNIRRNEMVAFSNYLQSEPHITVYSADRYNEIDLFIIISPMQPEAWIFSIIIMITFIVGVKIILKHEKLNISFNYVLVPTRILLEQSVQIPPYGRLRIGLCAWTLYAFALSSSYKSKLTSAIIKPATHEPSYLLELYNEGYHFISPAEDSTYLIELLQLSKNPVEHNIGKKLEDTKAVCEALERALTEVSAVIEERTVIRYDLWNFCIRNMTNKQLMSLRRLHDETTVNGHVWAMPKSAPYKDRISLILETIKSYGIISKWYNSYNITRPLSTPNTVKPPTKSLTANGLMSAWIILASGCLLGVIAFICERCFYTAKTHAFRPKLLHTDSRTRLQPALFDTSSIFD